MSQIKGRGGVTVHCPDEVRYRLIREIVSESMHIVHCRKTIDIIYIICMLNRYDHTGVRYEVWPKVDTADAVTPVPVLALPQNFFRKRIFRKIQQMDFTSPSFLVFHRSAPRHRATARLLTLVSGIRLGEDSAGINKVSQDTERSPLISSARVCVTKARSPLILVSVYPPWRAVNSLRPASLTGGARRCERVAAAVMTVSCVMLSCDMCVTPQQWFCGR